MIKKILAGMGATAGIGGLVMVIAYKPHHAPVVTMKPASATKPAVTSPSVPATPTPTPSAVPSPTPTVSAKPQPTPTPTSRATAATPTPTPTPTPSPTPTGQYKDGSYTGSVVAAGPFGNVQVQAVVSGGKITGVNFLLMPSGDIQTNNNTANCESKLPGETIQAQVANVQVVTGATQTSDAYIQSMTVALQAAKA